MSYVSPVLIPAISLTALMTAFQALPQNMRGWMPYERIPIENGQLWRLLSGNFIHLGWGHLILNGCGLLVIAWLFAEERRPTQWGSDLLICSLATGIGLYFFNPEIFWCVGLIGCFARTICSGSDQLGHRRHTARKMAFDGPGAETLLGIFCR